MLDLAVFTGGQFLWTLFFLVAFGVGLVVVVVVVEICFPFSTPLRAFLLTHH